MKSFALVSASLRNFLVRLGGLLTVRQIGVLRGVLKYLEAGSLLAQHGYTLRDVGRWVKVREQLFDLIASEIGERCVLSGTR